MDIANASSLAANLIAIASTAVAVAAWVIARKSRANKARPIRVYSPESAMAHAVAARLRAAGFRDVISLPFDASLSPSAFPVLALPDKADAAAWWGAHGSPEFGVVYSPGRVNLPPDWVAANSIPVSLPHWVGAAIEARWPA